MLKKTITFEDFEGNKRTEDFYFNLNKAELAEMQMSRQGGFTDWIQKVIDARDNTTLYATIKDFVLKSVGIKSPDGRRFIKNSEIREEFEQTEAYSELMMELMSDEKAFSAFCQGIIPKELSEKVAAESAKHPALKG